MHAAHGGGLEGLGPHAPLSTPVFCTLLSQGDRECTTTCNGDLSEMDACAGEMLVVRACQAVRCSAEVIHPLELMRDRHLQALIDCAFQQAGLNLPDARCACTVTNRSVFSSCMLGAQHCPWQA